MADTETNSQHPPKPWLALTVGIVGHRPNRLPDPDKADEKATYDKVVADVSGVLAAIKAAAIQGLADHRGLYVGDAPSLTLISALAAGSDSIAARAAVALGFMLDASLPFPASEYVADFHHSAKDPSNADQVAAAAQRSRTELAAFHDLLPQARSVFELPGERGSASDTKEERVRKEQRAYEAAGLTILSQADILIAVWDGEPSQGRGGTPELIAEASRAGLPMIVIDAKGVREPELRWRNLMAVPAPLVAVDDLPREPMPTSLRRLVDEVVRLPASPEQREAFDLWFEEADQCFNPRVGYPLLMTILFVRRMRLSDVFPSRVAALAKGYALPVAPLLELDAARRKRQALATNANAAISVDTLATPYAWADAIGIWCAQLFRSAFVLNFLFAALAVVAASLGVVLLYHEPGAPKLVEWLRKVEPSIWIGLEIFLIAYVLFNTWLGWRSHWHRRWYEAREMAERLRVALPLWAVGLRPGAFPGEEPTWTGWYVRAFVRMQGLRDGALSPDEYQAARSLLLHVLEDQCRYNENNASRMHRLEFRLEVVGLALFAATALVALDHLLHSPVLSCLFGGLLPPHEGAIWLSAALPALATATYGIRVIGDFEGIKRRAERTHTTLVQLIAAVRQDKMDVALLRARARSAGDAMLGDVSSWRLSAESRGLAIPG